MHPAILDQAQAIQDFLKFLHFLLPKGLKAGVCFEFLYFWGIAWKHARRQAGRVVPECDSPTMTSKFDLAVFKASDLMFSTGFITRPSQVMLPLYPESIRQDMRNPID